MKNLLYIIIVLVLTGCFSTKEVPAPPPPPVAPSLGLVQPSENDLKRAETKFEDVSLSDLQEGFTLYKAHCGNCHDLIDPTKKTEGVWRRILFSTFYFLKKHK